MFWMWRSAVFAEMKSRSPISRVVLPWAARRSTSTSRALRPPGRASRLAACLRSSASACWISRRANSAVSPRSIPRPAAPWVVEGRLAQLLHEAIRELGQIGHVLLTPGLADDGRVQCRRALEHADPFEQGGRTRESDRELGDVARLLEGVDGRVEHGERVVGIGVDQS